MKPLHATAALLLILAAVPRGAADTAKADGFVPLFNGTDLSGWVNVNCAPGTFFVRGHEIITTGKPTGYLRTARQYENFIAEFDWLHVNTKEVGNSGFFVWADPLPAVGTPYTRGIEVQVLVNLEKPGYYTSQGDLFSIHGATCIPDRPHPHGWARCLPSENRCKGGGQWNHYKVVARDGTLKLHVNGKEVSGLHHCRPRKGYLALESEGAECHFRNLKIKELPSSHPRPEEVAGLAQDFTTLFTGLDLSGWKADGAAREHWQPRDWMLHYDGRGAALATAKEYGAAAFIVDFHFPKKNGTPSCAFVLRDGKDDGVKLVLSAAGKFVLTVAGRDVAHGSLERALAGQWHRLHATPQGQSLRLTVDGKELARAPLTGAPARGVLALRPGEAMDFGNLFVRILNEDRRASGRSD